MKFSNLIEIPLDYPIFVRKHQEKKLYEWFDEVYPTEYWFREDFDIAQGKAKPNRLNQYFKMKDYDNFNFATLLNNNIIIENGSYTEKEKEIRFTVLDINRMSIEKFKELVHCMASMLSRYTDVRFDSIVISVFFFNTKEKEIFVSKWNKIKIGDYLVSKRIYPNIAYACEVQLISLDLDRKYHLRREID